MELTVLKLSIDIIQLSLILFTELLFAIELNSYLLPFLYLITKKNIYPTVNEIIVFIISSNNRIAKRGNSLMDSAAKEVTNISISVSDLLSHNRGHEDEGNTLGRKTSSSGKILMTLQQLCRMAKEREL